MRNLLNEETTLHIQLSDLELVRDQAFYCYYLLRLGKQEEVLPFLDKKAELLRNEISFFDAAYFLWIAGEYLNSVGQSDWLTANRMVLETALNHVRDTWKNPQYHWLSNVPQQREFMKTHGIYLSNLSLAYGAVQAVNNTLRDETGQKVLKDIREFLFEHFLSGGKVVSSLGSKAIFGDIGLVAIPFGLLNAGDQVLVRSIQQSEEQLVNRGVRFSEEDTYFGGCSRPDLTCLLAWYYSELGNITQVKRLTKHVEEMLQDNDLLELDLTSAKEDLYLQFWKEAEGTPLKSNLGVILYEIVKLNVKEKEATGTTSDSSISIIHEPTGSSSPYRFELMERTPRYPIENEVVFLQMKTDVLLPSLSTKAVYRVDDGEWIHVDMDLERTTEGDKYWKATIGSFKFGDKVEYQFEVNNEGIITKSEIFSFEIRKWLALKPEVIMQEQQDKISIYFQSLQESKVPVMNIFHRNATSIQWSFTIDSSAAVQKEYKKSVTDEMTFVLGDFEFAIDSTTGDFKLKQAQSGIASQNMNSHHIPAMEILTDHHGHVFQYRWNLKMSSEEHIFGMGERYTDIEFNGQDIDQYVFNQYKDQGYRTYIPVPFMMSSKQYGIFLDTTMYSRFRFGTVLPDWMMIEQDVNAKHPEVNFYLFAGTPKEMLSEFTQITGKPKLPPKWSFGPWMSSNNWDSQAETMKQVELTQKYRIPSTVLVLEQWSDEATFYIFNDAQYPLKSGSDSFHYEDFSFPEWGRWPDPKKMIDDIHQAGIKVLLWQIPVMKFMEGVSHAQKDEDEKVMLEQGYQVSHESGESYRIPGFEWFKGSLIPDFTNPDTKEWWFEKRRYLMEGLQIDGFKTDGGECIYGDDLVFHDGSSTAEMRNRYPNDYIGSYYDFVQQTTDGDGITFSRAGYTGAQNFPMHWAGDERSTFEAFQSSIHAGLSSGMSGLSFWGWDLGGFHGDIPTAELFVRSAQMAAFCPVMQYHAETKGEFNQDRTPWNIAEQRQKPYALELYKKFADLRMNILPYVFQEAMKSSISGIPLMRSMFLEFPDDQSCISLNEQYMFGDSMLVAPQTQESQTFVDVYFPTGQWMNLFDGSIQEGASYQRIKAELHEIPVFVREDSVIPLHLANNLQLCSDVGNRLDGYDELSFLIFVNSSTDYQFADDLGNKIGLYIETQNSKTIIDLDSTYQENINLIIRHPRTPQHIQSQTEVFKSVADLQMLEEQSYYFRENELILRITGEHRQIIIQH